MPTRRALIGSAAALSAFATLPSRLCAETLAADQSIRYGLGFDDITSLDPHMAVLSSDIPIVANIYDGLLNLPNGDLTSDRYQPGLAERWEASPDKKQWTFFLRKGVRWHGDYGEFSLEDAKFTIERVAGKGFTSPFRGYHGQCRPC